MRTFACRLRTVVDRPQTGLNLGPSAVGRRPALIGTGATVRAHLDCIWPSKSQPLASRGPPLTRHHTSRPGPTMVDFGDMIGEDAAPLHERSKHERGPGHLAPRRRWKQPTVCRGRRRGQARIANPWAPPPSTETTSLRARQRRCTVSVQTHARGGGREEDLRAGWTEKHGPGNGRLG